MTLDPRLKGLKWSDVTLKFVRENATPKEIEEAEFKSPLVRRVVKSCDYDPVDLTNKGVLEDLRAFLLLMEDTVQNNDVELEWSHEGEVSAYFYGMAPAPNQPNLSGEKAIQKLWKDQVKEAEQKRRDLDEYMRLKEKLGLED